MAIDRDLGPRVSPKLTARRDGDGWVLSGQKSAWVSNGPVATHRYLFVGIDASKGMRGNGIALVDLRSPGVSRGKPGTTVRYSRTSTRTQSTSISAGNCVEPSGLPGQFPPTATLRRRKKSWSKTQVSSAGMSAGVRSACSSPST